MRERREDCGDGSDDTTEETEDQVGGLLYPDHALSLPLSTLNNKCDKIGICQINTTVFVSIKKRFIFENHNFTNQF